MENDDLENLESLPKKGMSAEKNPLYVRKETRNQPKPILDRPARKQAKMKPADFTQNVSGECNKSKKDWEKQIYSSSSFSFLQYKRQHLVWKVSWI